MILSLTIKCIKYRFDSFLFPPSKNRLKDDLARDKREKVFIEHLTCPDTKSIYHLAFNEWPKYANGGDAKKNIWLGNMQDYYFHSIFCFKTLVPPKFGSTRFHQKNLFIFRLCILLSLIHIFEIPVLKRPVMLHVGSKIDMLLQYLIDLIQNLLKGLFSYGNCNNLRNVLINTI